MPDQVKKPFINITLNQKEETMFNHLFQHPLFNKAVETLPEDDQFAFVTFLGKLTDAIHKAGWCDDTNCKELN